MSEIERWGQSNSWLPSTQNRKEERALSNLRGETRFVREVINATAVTAATTMDRTVDLYHYAVACSGGDENLQGALMGQVGGFIGRAEAIQRKFGSQFG